MIVFIIGLYVDVAADLPGQLAASAATWIALWAILPRVAPEERRQLMFCLVIATAGELFLSLGWGLYTYRLDNVPMYVPPGHALLFALGFTLARRMPMRLANGILIASVVYSLAAGAAGVDTFGLILGAVIAACALAMPARRPLFASTFVLALVLELYGTAIGNWFWAPVVPFTSLVTTNPPLAAGAFYCALDTLVVLAATRLPALLPVSTQPGTTG